MEDEFYENFSAKLGHIQKIEKAKEFYNKECGIANGEYNEAQKRFVYAMKSIESVDGYIDATLGYIEEKNYEAAQSCWYDVSPVIGDGEVTKYMKESIFLFYEKANSTISLKNRLYEASNEERFKEDILQIQKLMTDINIAEDRVMRKIDHYEEDEDINRYWREE